MSLLLSPLVANAQQPVAGELQINTVTSGDQGAPAVGVAYDGSFVVVWESAAGAGNDNDVAINGRRFAADGSALGLDFQINTYTTQRQTSPQVAVGQDGEFVVVWASYVSSGYNLVDATTTIRARRYDSAGVALGGDFVVNDLPNEGLLYPDVAMDAQGEFVVVWQGSYAGGDGDYGGIAAQRYDATGTGLGSNFQVNSFTSDTQAYPSVSAAAGGDFVVVWNSFASDGFGWGVRGRRFASDGSAVADDFAVNVLTDGNQLFPDVAVGPSGGFSVFWQGFATSGTDSEPSSIQGRRYDSVGVAQGSDFQVNSYTSNGQSDVSVAAFDGGFLAVWESTGSAGTDSSTVVNTSIQGRRIDAAGATPRDDFQINSYTTSFPAPGAVPFPKAASADRSRARDAL